MYLNFNFDFLYSHYIAKSTGCDEIDRASENIDQYIENIRSVNSAIIALPVGMALVQYFFYPSYLLPIAKLFHIFLSSLN